MNFTKILAFGDSWTAGHEIDPILLGVDGMHIMHEDNKEYRESRTYPYYISKELNVPFENLGFTGYSNDGITRTCIEYMESNKVENSLILIGWSSPERKDFFLKDNSWVTMRPDWDNTFRHFSFNKMVSKDLLYFHKLYSIYFWNDEEITQRFKDTNLLLNAYLSTSNNTVIFFNTFYRNIKLANIIEKSFISCIDSNDLLSDNQHPNSNGHKKWADYLLKFINNE